jgi:hypothetical protein
MLANSKYFFLPETATAGNSALMSMSFSEVSIRFTREREALFRSEIDTPEVVE